MERSKRIDKGLQEDGSAGDRVKLLLLGEHWVHFCFGAVVFLVMLIATGYGMYARSNTLSQYVQIDRCGRFSIV